MLKYTRTALKNLWQQVWNSIESKFEILVQVRFKSWFITIDWIESLPKKVQTILKNKSCHAKY